MPNVLARTDKGRCSCCQPEPVPIAGPYPVAFERSHNVLDSTVWRAYTLLDQHGKVLACKCGSHADDQWSVDELLQFAALRA